MTLNRDFMLKFNNLIIGDIEMKLHNDYTNYLFFPPNFSISDTYVTKAVKSLLWQR